MINLFSYQLSTVTYSCHADCLYPESIQKLLIKTKSDFGLDFEIEKSLKSTNYQAPKSLGSIGSMLYSRETFFKSTAIGTGFCFDSNIQRV